MAFLFFFPEKRIRYNRENYFRIETSQLSSIGLSCLVFIIAMEVVCRGDKGKGGNEPCGVVPPSFG